MTRWREINIVYCRSPRQGVVLVVTVSCGEVYVVLLCKWNI